MLVRKCLAAEIPGAIEIIFCPRTVDGWQVVAIDKEHVVAFAEPSVLVLQYGLRYANEVSFTYGLEKHVVVSPAQVLSVAHDAFARRGLPVLRMESAQPAGKAWQRHVINREVEAAHWLRSLIGHRDARSGGERHLEIRVERFDRRHGQQR